MAIYANHVLLPDPTGITINNELIWSQDTGRALDGRMWGIVIAEKFNISVKWEYLTEAEVAVIRNNCTGGFFPLTFDDVGGSTSITVYRGTLSYERLGTIAGVTYYKSVTVDLIQR